MMPMAALAMMLLLAGCSVKGSVDSPEGTVTHVTTVPQQDIDALKAAQKRMDNLEDRLKDLEKRQERAVKDLEKARKDYEKRTQQLKDRG
jgi:molecular chaperone GrpE (heat shock protein)